MRNSHIREAPRAKDYEVYRMTADSSPLTEILVQSLYFTPSYDLKSYMFN